MRMTPSSVVTVFVALLFVSGTVGCRSNGGPWYNPKSYAFTNPFTKDKDNPAPPFSAGHTAQGKPSLGAKPNVDVPDGGYSDSSRLATRSPSQSGMQGGHSFESQPSPVASSLHSGYSVADPSPYPSHYMSGQPSVTTASHAQYQYQPEMQHGINQGPYGYDYPAGTQYHPVNMVSPSTTPNYATAENFGSAFGSTGPSAMSGGNYAPFGAAQPQQNDPYGAMVQPQPATQFPYASESMPTAFPHQPQPYHPQSSGYSY